MRIVDVNAFYAPLGGGVRTYAIRKMTAAAAAGHELVLLVPGATDAVEEAADGGLIATIASPKLMVDRRYRYFHDEAALHRALSAWRPDFVEASSPWSSASMAARWPGTSPRSLVMHADPLAAYAYRWFGGLADIAVIDRGFERFWAHLRRLDAQFDVVVTASHAFTRRLWAGGLRGVTTIPMGVEPGIFASSRRDPALRAELLAACGLDEDATLLLGVGRYSTEKRWPMVIEAAIAAGRRRPIGLYLVGEGRSRRRLAAAAAGSPHIVIGAPVRDRVRIAAMLASADALVHGCEAETFCMVGAEARASGLPVIMPDRGGAADHVVDTHSRTYRCGDGAALREAIVSMASRPRVAIPAHTVRSMDDHFAELFAAYRALGSPRSIAA